MAETSGKFNHSGKPDAFLHFYSHKPRNVCVPRAKYIFPADLNEFAFMWEIFGLIKSPFRTLASKILTILVQTKRPYLLFQSV
jgi:hypothetical protein